MDRFYEKTEKGMTVRNRMLFHVIELNINYREDVEVPSSFRLQTTGIESSHLLKQKMFQGSF